MADRPSVSFALSDGMETVSVLKEYVRFLFKHLQEKDVLIKPRRPAPANLRMKIPLTVRKTRMISMAMAIFPKYHTVIETCKLQGYSVLEYLEAFFTAIIKGRTDYEILMPSTIGIRRINKR